MGLNLISPPLTPSLALPSSKTSINRRPIAAFALCTLAYLAAVSTLSHFKLLWLDELITFHIANLGNFREIWQALAYAADPNPPLTHLAVLLSMRLFGTHELALRLPAIIGYWSGLLALFLFFIRRVPLIWALAGVFFSMANAAFDYSYESRSYGIFYGLAMIAFLCWTDAIDPLLSATRRRVALCGMTLALALGISSNYFAVLAFFPIAGGEIVRTVRLGRLYSHFGLSRRSAMHFSTWATLTLAATPMLAFRPLIQRSIAQFAPHAWNKVSLDQVFDSYLQMVEVILPPTIVLLILAFAVSLLSRLCAHCREHLQPRWLSHLADHHAAHHPLSLPLHEAAAVLLLMLYPFLGYLVASIKGGMLSPRFVIPVCLGFAIAGTISAFRVFGHLRYAGMIALTLAFAVFLGRAINVGYNYSQQRATFYQVLNNIPSAASNKPIVVADPLMVLTLQHYAPPAVASRIVFPVDFPAIRKVRGEDSPEENLWAGRNSIYHLPIVTLADFQRNAGDYLILASDGNWLVRDLWTHSYPVSRLNISFPAGTIKGFTPLNHADPVFFVAAGDRTYRTDLCPSPMPFLAAANLPSAPPLPYNSGL